MDKATRKRLKQRAREILAQRDAAYAAAPDKEFQKRVSTLSGINAYLFALEHLHHGSDTSTTLRFERLDASPDDPHAAMIRHLNEPHYTIGLVPINDWQRELIQDLPTWIFGETPLNATTRKALVETLVLLLAQALNDPATCWRADIAQNRGPFYACYARDYLFPTPRGLYLLHADLCD